MGAKARTMECYTMIYNLINHLINPLPNKQFSDWSKLKAFADDKINVTEKLKFDLEIKGRKHCGKRRNAGYQHFILFRQCFQVSDTGSLKVEICGKEYRHQHFTKFYYILLIRHLHFVTFC